MRVVANISIEGRVNVRGFSSYDVFAILETVRTDSMTLFTKSTSKNKETLAAAATAG